MNEYIRDERRNAIRSNIDEALGHIERNGATGIEMQLRDGAHASGDWATTSRDGVTVFSSVMGITSAQTLLLDDILIVQTVWSDVTPAYVAPDRFDAVFDRLLVESVGRLLDASTIGDALKGMDALAERFGRIENLDPWQSDEVFGMVAARLPKGLKPRMDLHLLNMPVFELVESEREVMLRHLNPEVIAHVANEPLTSSDPIRLKTMLDLSKDHPDVANAMLLEMMRLEVRRNAERYVPLDKLRFMIEEALVRCFERSGS